MSKGKEVRKQPKEKPKDIKKEMPNAVKPQSNKK
jgi:hypothetical protein